jgi:hypothetical protein
VLLHNVTQIEPTDIPRIIFDDIEPVKNDLELRGFKYVLAFSEILAQGVGGVSLLFLSADRVCWARILAFHVTGDTYHESRLAFEVCSRRKDNNYLRTSNTPRRKVTNPELATEFLPGASVEQILEHHRRRAVDCMDLQTISEKDLWEMYIQQCQNTDSRQIEKNGFVPATEEEIEQYRDEIII